MAWLAAANQKPGRDQHKWVVDNNKRAVGDLELISLERGQAGRQYLVQHGMYTDLLELEAPKGTGPDEPVGLA
jgi:hypothetical protein